MIFILALLVSGSQFSGGDSWLLRAGGETGSIPLDVTSYLYTSANTVIISDISFTDITDGIEGGDASMVVPLVASLVLQGEMELAETCWNLHGTEIPATRSDLLDALSWFGRYELYREMALNPVIPPDMEGKMHGDQCGAVCSLGWMRTRIDGMFHGNEFVSPLDIKVLSIYFPGVDASAECITVAEIEDIFHRSGGGSP
ncbi:MAG: hypothetical protein J7K88_11445 [Candidatus Fermentibacteraceae bacterium]|nr:hypothetical protein [Candidatus Fermentibacteraceae bacterium]